MAMQEDPLLRLDRLQRQLAEAQAIVQSLPAPEANARQGATSNNVASGMPSSTAAKDEHEALGPAEIIHEASDILPQSQEAIRYPLIFSTDLKQARVMSPEALPRGKNADKNRPFETLQQPSTSNFVAERKENIPWSDQQLDLRSQHQRRRDALANAKERLAELQVCHNPADSACPSSCAASSNFTSVGKLKM